MLHRMTSGYEALSNANFLASMYRGVELIDAFGSAFTATVARERPANSANEYVFAPEGARVRDGMIVRVVPDEARRWCGMFSDGIPIFSPATSGIFAAPDPNRLFAVSYGNGYLVDVRSPVSAEIVLLNVCYVTPVPDAEVLVVADNATFFGIGQDGMRWERAIDADGFSNCRAAGSFFTAVVNRPGGTRVNIRVDASTGELLEGESFV
jgi:hypothetical protein